jgi:hypothetical protein
MKNIFKFLIVPLFFVAACTDDFDEINTNPNQPETVPPTYLLTYAQERLLDRLYDGFDNSRIGMTLAQYWAQNQYSEESRYQYRPATNNTTWNDFYTGINNLQEIIRYNEENEVLRNENQIAVARILKAWAFQTLTDIYGDIPYFEALNAREGTISPAYTPQSEIYQDLLKELTEASAQIDLNVRLDPDRPNGGDLIYAGDVSKWRKFANSLKLRVAIQMADRMPNEAILAIQEAVTAGVFESNADNAEIKYVSAQPNTNPLYVDVVVNGRIDYSSSDVLVNQLKQRNDPRLAAFFEPAVNSVTTADPDGEFIGRPYGQNQVNANALNADDVSQLSEKILSPDFPGKIMDFAEVNFILAEAAQRGASVNGTAAEYYARGIRASMEYWGVGTPAQINAYILANPYDPANYKQSIGVQKWIALYTQGFQGWTEYRRLDFQGVFKMPVDGPLISIDRVPLRRVYPPDEQTLNQNNYRAAVSNQGEDTYVTKVWWDVN